MDCFAALAMTWMGRGVSPARDQSASRLSSDMTSRISSANLSARPATRAKNVPGRTSVHRGRVVFGAMDEVVFGVGSEALVEQVSQAGAENAPSLVSGTSIAKPT